MIEYAIFTPKHPTALPEPAPQELNASLVSDAARDFEAAFLSQTLAYSGLTDALTNSGGEGVSAFASFYIDAIAKDLAENGGVGLAAAFEESLGATDTSSVQETPPK